MRQIKVSKEAFTPRVTKASSLYLNEVDKTKVMDPQKEAEIAFLAHNGDEEARLKLINSNLRFVLTVAKNYAKNPDDYAEIVAVGNIGLVEAASMFDPSRGFRFISFAVWHIRKEILKHLSDNGRTVRIPLNQVNTLKAMRDASGVISMKEGRNATFEETLDEIKKLDKFSRIKTSIIHDAIGADSKPSSLDSPLGDESGASTLIDIMDSGDSYSDEKTETDQKNSILLKLTEVLNSEEAEIILRKHGVAPYDNQEESFSRIAINMGVGLTPESIRIKYTRGIRKMGKYAHKLNYKISDIF
jgi:RNA polymerase primary sigma factor